MNVVQAISKSEYTRGKSDKKTKEEIFSSLNINYIIDTCYNNNIYLTKEKKISLIAVRT